jgi:hypothetical protein
MDMAFGATPLKERNRKRENLPTPLLREKDKERELPPDLFHSLSSSFEEKRSGNKEECRGGKGGCESKTSSDLWLSKILIPNSFRTPEFIEAWTEWIEYRIELYQIYRHPLTVRMFDKHMRQLYSMGLQKAIEAIDLAIMCGWRGIYPVDARARVPQQRKIDKWDGL